jgi:predicted RNase H-like nuclease (RuvC/YqgF family)
VKPKPASNLIHIVGSPERANELIGAEMERRLAIVQSRRERDWAMEQRIIAARQQVESLRSRVGTMDPTIKMRKDRVAAYESLMAKGTLARTTVLQAQAELTNDERARGDMLNQLQQAEQALHQLETEKATMEASTRSDLETAIVSVSQQIQSASREADTAGSILVAMKGKVTPISATSGPEPAQAPKYEIVRQTDKGPVVFAAREMSVLRPGDLVRIAESQQPRPMVPSDNAAPSRTNTVPISATDQTGCKQPDR